MGRDHKHMTPADFDWLGEERPETPEKVREAIAKIRKMADWNDAQLALLQIAEVEGAPLVFTQDLTYDLLRLGYRKFNLFVWVLRVRGTHLVTDTSAESDRTELLRIAEGLVFSDMLSITTWDHGKVQTVTPTKAIPFIHKLKVSGPSAQPRSYLRLNVGAARDQQWAMSSCGVSDPRAWSEPRLAAAALDRMLGASTETPWVWVADVGWMNLSDATAFWKERY